MIQHITSVYVSAILEFNMAAITATFSASYGIPWPLKRGLSNKQNVSTCLSFGVIAENRSKMAAILNFKMAATRGREYVGGIFYQLPLGGSTHVQSFMFHTCFKNWMNDSGALPLYYDNVIHPQIRDTPDTSLWEPALACSMTKCRDRIWIICLMMFVRLTYNVMSVYQAS